MSSLSVSFTLPPQTSLTQSSLALILRISIAPDLDSPFNRHLYCTTSPSPLTLAQTHHHLHYFSILILPASFLVCYFQKSRENKVRMPETDNCFTIFRTVLLNGVTDQSLERNKTETRTWFPLPKMAASRGLMAAVHHGWPPFFSFPSTDILSCIQATRQTNTGLPKSEWMHHHDTGWDIHTNRKTETKYFTDKPNVICNLSTVTGRRFYKNAGSYKWRQ